MEESKDSANSEGNANPISSTSIFSKRFENGDHFLIRASLPLVIPILMIFSLYLTTFTFGIDIENFYSEDVEFIGTQKISGNELNLYAFNIEEYRGFYGDGMGFDSEDTKKGWNPNLVKNSEELGISINARSDVVSGRYFGSVLCPEGINDCEDSVRSGGKTWVPLEGALGVSYVSYDSNLFTDSYIVVALEDNLEPYELFITLEAERNTGRWYLSVAIAPMGFCFLFYVAHMSNREDIKRGLKLSNEGFDNASSSYVLTLMNTIIKPVTGSYYLSLLYWISIDGDWWGNPNAAFSALIIGFVPPVVAFLTKSSPIPEGRSMNLWGAILYFPMCFFAVGFALLTLEGIM